MTTQPHIKTLLLAAGFGTRLKPLTDFWPKCLMPIGETPLLEYWLYYLYKANIEDVLVNTHHHSNIVLDFLKRPHLNWVRSIYEEKLLGTAGTLINNYRYFKGHPTLLIHADNWTNSFLNEFIEYHFKSRPKKCLITMMLFHTETPELCGIVELDYNHIVVKFHEKKKQSFGNLANAAIYILEPEVLEWLIKRPWISDFTTEVIPHFLGKIATWTNKGIFRDIGSNSSLKKAQSDVKPILTWGDDSWALKFNDSIVQKFNLETK